METLTGSSDPLSAQEVYLSLRSGGSSVGLATVYRELHALIGSGEVQLLRTSARARFLALSRAVMICDQCGRSTDLDAARTEALHALKDAFFAPSAPVSLHGTCTTCGRTRTTIGRGIARDSTSGGPSTASAP